MKDKSTFQPAVNTPRIEWSSARPRTKVTLVYIQMRRLYVLDWYKMRHAYSVFEHSTHTWIWVPKSLTTEWVLLCLSVWAKIISQWIGWAIDWKLKNNFNTLLILQVIYQAKIPNICCLHFLRREDFLLFSVLCNAFGFWTVSHSQSKQFEDVTLGFTNLWWVFLTFEK